MKARSLLKQFTTGVSFHTCPEISAAILQCKAILRLKHYCFGPFLPEFIAIIPLLNPNFCLILGLHVLKRGEGMLIWAFQLKNLTAISDIYNVQSLGVFS